MKKVVLFSLCAAAFMASCNNQTSQTNNDAIQAQNDSLMLELSNRDAELDEMLNASLENPQASKFFLNALSFELRRRR